MNWPTKGEWSAFQFSVILLLTSLLTDLNSFDLVNPYLSSCFSNYVCKCSLMKKVVELSLNIVIHLKVDGDGTSSALENGGRWMLSGGAVHKRRRQFGGGRGSNFIDICRGAEVKKFRHGGGGVKKSRKNIFYG